MASITLASDQLISWPVFIACSARQSPWGWLCSGPFCFPLGGGSVSFQSGQHKWPGSHHREPGMPHQSSPQEEQGLSHESGCISVLSGGLKQVLIPSGVSTLLTTSEVRFTQWMITVVSVGGAGVLSCWRCEGERLRILSGYPLLIKASLAWSFSSVLSLANVHRRFALRYKVRTTATLCAMGWWDWKSRYVLVSCKLW